MPDLIRHTWSVKFFQTSRGNSPVEDFIREQNSQTYSKILHYIILLKQGGPFLKPPQSKKLKPNLYELRVVGKEQIRIFYTRLKGAYYLLHAFKKKSQKLSLKEIEIAVDRVKELV